MIENRKLNSRVIIVGIDHHNMLNLAREFFENGIKPVGIIVGARHSIVAKSRYWSTTYIIDSIHSLIPLIKNICHGRKYIVIPTSDESAMEIDNHLKQLKDIIAPSINNTQSGISNLMNKEEQVFLAHKLNIKCAKSCVIELEDEEGSCDWTIFPCILKPLIAGTGNKNDISICNSQSEYADCLQSFICKKYKRILIQEYLHYDYEILVCGAISKRVSVKDSFFANRVLRSWPPKKGTGCFEKIITDKTILDQCADILLKLQEMGFEGLIDIELFYCNGEVYLNEINWRNSGGYYRGHSLNNNIAYNWYLDMIGKEPNSVCLNYRADYSMTEYSDYRYPLYTSYGWIKWFKDLFRAKNFAYLRLNDPLPMMLMFFAVIKKHIIGKGQQ